MRQKLLTLKRLSVPRVLTVFSLTLASCAQPGSAGYTTVLSQLPAASAVVPLSPQQRLAYDVIGAQATGLYYSFLPTYNVYYWPNGYGSYDSYDYWQGHYSRYGW
ncbi:hypothetical protein [Mycoavidus sp. B2-EB]|uniref:hypothetical protein n=1 Tax=Mycoavidus sp. B2-EB TaxID=2651972 RepID=UPI001627D480|nr:hypothetical protein [Mycoavidus sp. B2-EB]BBO59608.1 hypothetical protein MPB2EB_0732 [Mycoavidus sp. B2-EB]